MRNRSFLVAALVLLPAAAALSACGSAAPTPSEHESLGRVDQADSCGGLLQPPCPGNVCHQGHFDPSWGLCDNCGEAGQPCCNHGNPPVTPNCYDWSQCSDPSSGSGMCQACGQASQPPCAEGGCNAGFVLSNGLCVAATTCGEMLSPPCPGNVCHQGHFDPAWGLCDHCGEPGEACCNHGNAPVTQDCFDWSQCSDPTVGYGVCSGCGGIGQAPCLSGGCNASAGAMQWQGSCVASAGCGEIGHPECQTGDPCDTAAGAVPQRGYARSAGSCVECGSCGELACPPTFPNECGSALTPFPGTGENVCWMGSVGSCSPPKSGGGGGSGGGTGGGTGGKGGGGAGDAGTCECTSTNADNNIAKCGAGLFEICDPSVPQSSPDKSKICRPTLGCTLDANGSGPYRCTLPTPQDNWPSPCGAESSQLATCWSSSEVGLCEDGVPKNKRAICTPVTCQAAGAQCGWIADGCGGTLNCGGCGSNAACTSANLCVRMPPIHGGGGGGGRGGGCGSRLCQ